MSNAQRGFDFDFTWNKETKTVTIQFKPSWWDVRPDTFRHIPPHMKERCRPQELDVEWMRNKLIEVLNEGSPNA